MKVIVLVALALLLSVAAHATTLSNVSATPTPTGLVFSGQLSPDAEGFNTPGHYTLAFAFENSGGPFKVFASVPAPCTGDSLLRVYDNATGATTGSAVLHFSGEFFAVEIPWEALGRPASVHWVARLHHWRQLIPGDVRSCVEVSPTQRQTGSVVTLFFARLLWR